MGREAIDEVGDSVRLMSARAQTLGQLREFLRRLFGKHLPRFGRLQTLRIEEAVAEQIAGGAVQQVIEREFVHLLDRIGPIGVDAKPVHVADDQ